MADTQNFTFSFVMAEKCSGRFLYVHEEKQLYMHAADVKDGQSFRCVNRKGNCKARVLVNVEKNTCEKTSKSVPHNHDDSCEERYKKLKALEEIKNSLSSVENMASGSRMKRPREVYKSAVVK